MSLRPLQDCIVVKLEPVPRRESGIITVAPEPVRIGCVTAAGPGKRYPDKFVPTQVQVGDRVAFFKAVTETQQGERVGHHLDDETVLLRETDVLFVVQDGVDIEVGQ